MIKTFIICLLITGSLQAQDLKLKFGATFGKTIFSSGSFVDLDGVLVGEAASLGVDYWNKKRLFLSSEVGIIKTGVTGNTHSPVPGNGAQPIHKYIAKISVRSLTASTLLNLKLSANEGRVLYIGIGPRVDYLLDYKENNKLLQPAEAGKYLHKTIYGISCLLGSKFTFNKFNWGFELKYNPNFNNFVDNIEYSGFHRGFIINYMTFGLSFGYALK
jgi:hypothetical protein